MRSTAFKAITGSVLLFLSFASQATCPYMPDVTNNRATSNTAYSPVSGLSYATYFIEASMGGGNAGLINLSIQALPGFTYPSNGRKGFVGNGADLYISYFVAPSAPIGSYRDVDYRILNSVGQVICIDQFRVTVGG